MSLYGHSVDEMKVSASGSIKTGFAILYINAMLYLGLALVRFVLVADSSLLSIKPWYTMNACSPLPIKAFNFSLFHAHNF